MKILIAPDSFKDSISSIDFCIAATKGIKDLYPAIECLSFPLADGGEGTAQILTNHFKGVFQTITVQNPTFSPIEAQYGISSDKKLAFIDMAVASGLELLTPEKRNCYTTTTYGTGELIKDAIEKGVQTIILGIGSSATNDAGIGMAAALGYRFLDQNDDPVIPIGEYLRKIKKIDTSQVHSQLEKVNFIVACDVDNPLYGPNGAAYVYGPQKGADSEEIEFLDKGLQNFSEIVKRDMGKEIAEIPGAGAAGGMGAGTMVFLDAELKKGAHLVMDLMQFEQELANADLVITGEGKIDAQTLSGKVVKSIVEKVQQHEIPVVAFCGKLEASNIQIQELGLDYALSVIDGPCTLETALGNARANIEKSAGLLVHFYQKMTKKEEN